MPVTFQPNEIYTMAVQIERNGSEFYRKAAENATDASLRQTLLDLAAMEDDHEQTFQQMKDRLPGPGTATADPMGEGGLYLQAMVEGKIFDLSVKPAEGLTGAETTEDILDRAIGLEKDSILFYVTMKGMVPVNGGKEKIDAIIDQEVGHIATLTKKLQALGSAQ